MADEILNPKPVEGGVLRGRLGGVEIGQGNLTAGVAHSGVTAPPKLGNHILDNGQEEAPELAFGAIGLLQKLLPADPNEGFLDDVLGILVAKPGLTRELVQRPTVSMNDHLLDPGGLRTGLQDARPHGRGQMHR